MNPETMTLFDRMDGDRILPEALQKFNDKVIKDPLLIPFFENLDKEAVVEHQKLALMLAMGGCSKWEGRTLRQMHSKLTLDDKEFDAFLNHMVDALQEMDIAEHLLDESKKIIEATRREVLNKARF